MILIDAVYINEGGSLVLLKYLIEELEKRKITCFYLLDKRAENHFKNLGRNCEFIDNKIINRLQFYLKHKNFKKIFCFNSAPPPIFLNIPVYVYFHNPYLINPNTNLCISKKIQYFIKHLYMHFFKKSVNLWFVQNQRMLNSLSQKYIKNIKNKIILAPFYPQLIGTKNIERKEKSFIYVSTYYPHKNHEKLIEAFCQAWDEGSKGKLNLTIPQKATKIYNLINKKKKQGYPINNLGFLKRTELANIYKNHEFLIFPSFDETFGLGLAEAIDNGCKVIASDLPYTYEICKPSLTFDPNSTQSIKDSIILAINEKTKKSQKIIDNNINIIISYLE